MTDLEITMQFTKLHKRHLQKRWNDLILSLFLMAIAIFVPLIAEPSNIGLAAGIAGILGAQSSLNLGRVRKSWDESDELKLLKVVMKKSDNSITT